MNRKIVNILLLLFVCFTLYNTLIPFSFQYNPKRLSGLYHSISWASVFLQFKSGSKTDIIGNIILFMPLGFLLYLWRYQRRLHSPALYSVITGFILSLSIEFLQLFFGGRISSVTDIFNNSLGTFFGALFASIYLLYFAETLQKTVKKMLLEQPMVLILWVFLVLQFLNAAFPFNVTITVSELKTGLKQANIVPFHNQSLGLVLFNHTMQFDGTPFDGFKFMENVLFWMCWGYFLNLCYRLVWKAKTGGKITVVVLVLFPAMVLEFTQIFINSRFCDINDVVSNWIGTVSGLVFFSVLNSNKNAVLPDGVEASRGCIWIYFVFIIFSGLKPFDISLSKGVIFSSDNLSALVPFLGYFKNTQIWNIDDVIKSLTAFLPIGFYWSYRLFRQRYPWQRIYLVMGGCGFMVGVFIEAAQFFSVTRSSDITDALLFGVSGWLGTFSLYYYLKVIRPRL